LTSESGIVLNCVGCIATKSFHFELKVLGKKLTDNHSRLQTRDAGMRFPKNGERLRAPITTRSVVGLFETDPLPNLEPRLCLETTQIK